jgi:hypothetical protein
LATRDKVKASQQYKAWYARNKEAKRAYDNEWQLMYRYGITREQFTEMLVAQEGVCAICRQPETQVDKRSGVPRQLAVDHCHTTGRVRGLLCTHCNHAIGKFKDSVELLQRAIDYLK